MPTTRAPMWRATCPAVLPTGPVQAETTTVSPGSGCPRCTVPAHPVSPGMPSTPSAVETGAAAGSSLRTPCPDDKAYSCQPLRTAT
jgi:hypothetical protein